MKFKMNRFFTKKTLLMFLFSLLFGVTQLNAQQYKISGYFQPQMQINEANDNGYLFGVRRGRMKFEFNKDIVKADISLDVTEKGIAIKGVSLLIKEPFWDIFSFRAGIFSRPFGYEVGLSNSLRESPERALITQKLFPDEQDLGVMLSVGAPKNTLLHGLKLDAGLFSGNGIRLDDDHRVDFIGHLYYKKSFENINFGIGTSLYRGSTNNADSSLFTVENGKWNETKVNPNQKLRRQYIGFDGQFELKSVIGKTKLSGEYVFGKQPSQSSDFLAPKGNTYSIDKPFSFNRKFMGGYIAFVQSIAQLPLSAIVKYSWLDPNTELKGDEIYNKTDLQLSTIGFGLLWDINKDLKLTAYYEVNQNEKTANVKSYDKDVKDNGFTLRLQYVF